MSALALAAAIVGGCTYETESARYAQPPTVDHTAVIMVIAAAEIEVEVPLEASDYEIWTDDPAEYGIDETAAAAGCMFAGDTVGHWCACTEDGYVVCIELLDTVARERIPMM